MDRPFDIVMSRAMIETTKYLVTEMNAVVGYTQSDEISLAWRYPESDKGESWFGGRVQKLVSILASMATAKFNNYLPIVLDHQRDSLDNKLYSELPVFDCRVFNLPNLDEAANAFLWRELDATKNAISMAASCHFPYNDLKYKTGKEKQELLMKVYGVNFNNYPAFFKRGTFIRKITEERELTDDELSRIPMRHRPEGKVKRHRVVEMDMPKLLTVTNRVGVLFRGEDPVTQELVESPFPGIKQTEESL
jgi:tRNA(His) 5'-end guanylyltransferase